jgi:hypothetical protein
LEALTQRFVSRRHGPQSRTWPEWAGDEAETSRPKHGRMEP